MTPRPLCLIACYDRNRVIGCRGRIPWHCPQDLARFKQLTMGHALIIGWKTFLSLPKPLPGRQLIVLSRSPESPAPGCRRAESFDQALRLASASDPCPFVAGGAAVYAQALPLVSRMYLTELYDAYPGDTCFPAFDENDWNEVQREEHQNLVFRVLERIGD